jgi:hypothetical protein
VEVYVGVDGRMVVDGDAGDSGRLNGDVRGEPKERGDGLYVEGRDCKRSVGIMNLERRYTIVDSRYNFAGWIIAITDS